MLSQEESIPHVVFERQIAVDMLRGIESGKLCDALNTVLYHLLCLGGRDQAVTHVLL